MNPVEQSAGFFYACQALPMDYVFQYMRGQLRDSHPPLLADFERRSEAAARDLECELDLAYGSHERQRLDVFYAQGQLRGSVVYFHAGYWQSRDKAQFRFLADGFVRHGFNFIGVNYPLCPEVALDALVDACAEALPFVLTRLQGRQPVGQGLIVSGHSAGGHIAVELALRESQGRIAEILAISGVYDLVPLIDTPLNDKIKLSRDDALRNSPVLRSKMTGIPARFMVGGLETDEFKRQTLEMADAWQVAGNEANFEEIAGCDHFSVLDEIVTIFGR